MCIRDRGNELVHAEGLGDVVVGAGIETADLVGLLRARRQHDDGHERTEAPELLADRGRYEARPRSAKSSSSGSRLQAWRQPPSPLLAPPVVSPPSSLMHCK